MCGIVGIFSKNTIIDKSLLIKMRDTMCHRGPDDSGEWWANDGSIGLGHRRLSIIDLSPMGHQPMHDKTGKLTIVFNGEIYNYLELREKLIKLGYSFRSNSDTEVILNSYIHWGSDCLKELNGMFALAIYNSEKKQLFIARDRVGEKPLFYALINSTFYFASELKALLANTDFPRKINLESLDCYLTFGYVTREKCILEKVNKLPPAHALTFNADNQQLKLWQYWNIPEYVEASNLDEEELLDELEILLEDSVKHQLLADVPVGILLSGGVDSSLITAMAARSVSKVSTFTIIFPKYRSYDESKHAKLISNYFNTEHIELEAKESSYELLPLLAKQFDEPMCDSSMIPTFLITQLIRKYCTVALGGDGGDELFGGYRHYSRLLWMQKRLSYIPYFLKHGVAYVAEHWLPVGQKGRNYLQRVGMDLRYRLPQLTTCFDPTVRRSLMKSLPCYSLVAENIYYDGIPIQTDLLQRATRMDFRNYLTEDILVKVDRASMFNSLEVRAPLLDYRLIQFAFGRVPSYLKATINDRKILLKRLATRILPQGFDCKRKQGFSIPLDEWLKAGPFRELFRDVLLSSDCIFDRCIIKRLFNEQDKGYNNSERLFALVQFELWRRHYDVLL